MSEKLTSIIILVHLREILCRLADPTDVKHRATPGDAAE